VAAAAEVAAEAVAEHHLHQVLLLILTAMVVLVFLHLLLPLTQALHNQIILQKMVIILLVGIQIKL
jgi:hypothetical protein